MVKRSQLLEENNSKIKQKKIQKISQPKMMIGAHVSMQGGLFNAFANANLIGAKAFALFLSNQRRWDCKPLSKKDIDLFKSECLKNEILIDHIVPHGSYLLNCGSPKEETLSKSRNLFIKELQTCDQLGLKYFNFHPGSTCGLASREDTISKIAASINMGISMSKSVIVLIENMCGQGNTIGGQFEEIKKIISLVEDNSRIGVCLDTCHAFAAGYPLNSKNGYDDMMEAFDKCIGLKYLKALHLNDSKVVCGKHVDRHEDIGKGLIGLEFFTKLVNDSRLLGIPMVLETPGVDSYEKQIQLLYSLIKK